MVDNEIAYAAPEGWKHVSLISCLDGARSVRYGVVQPGRFNLNGPLMLRSQDYSKGWTSPDEMFRVSPELAIQYRNAQIRSGDLIITVVGAGVGQVEIAPVWLDGAVLSRSTARIAVDSDKINAEFLREVLLSRMFKMQIRDLLKEGAQPVVSCKDLEKCKIILPPIAEQNRIANAIINVNDLLLNATKLIAKKRDIKQATMQQLLTGKTRLPGFSGKWEERTLAETVDCLDHLRVPLNESEREKMRGDYPYCGANGVVGSVNDYKIDDDIILIAEDGGYFDEYAYRPIAYRMTGKCWVNNHAHILKAKNHVDQSYVFYSLVHKNILRFLASGTRAKLNKSEMFKISICMPESFKEQTAISEILCNIDAEITTLEQKLSKLKHLKQGMMQELLTGRIRLI